MPNRLIAFSGKAQSGKTESSNILKALVEKEGLEFRRISFASALKEIAKEYFGWDGDKELYYDHSHTMPPAGPLPNTSAAVYIVPQLIQDKGRQLLINIGAKFREIRPTIWADIVYDRIIKTNAETPNGIIFCIDDLRFKNEIGIVKKIPNSTIIRLIRPDGQLDIDDISEKDLDDVAFENVVYNQGTLEELAEKVETIYKNAPKA
jgi:hypothetical protein